MQEELETVRKEVAIAEDKLATSLYTVLAQEATCAQNLGDYLHQLKVNNTFLFWVKLCSFSSLLKLCSFSSLLKLCSFSSLLKLGSVSSLMKLYSIDVFGLLRVTRGNTQADPEDAKL